MLYVEAEGHARSWREHGYIHIHSAISVDQVIRTIDAIFEFLQMDRGNSRDWYDETKRARSGIDRQGRIPFYHHQALWDNRQNAAIYGAYAQIFGSRDLLVSIDRVNMNPPVTATWPYDGFIHWDIDVSKRPLDQTIQGILCLTDDDGTSGGFQCVPGFHNTLEAWLARQPPGYATRCPDTSDMTITPIPMKAGDYLIFHGFLPHGNRANLSRHPRLAQYFTMFPRSDLGPHALARRLRAYELGRPTDSSTGKPFPFVEDKVQDTSDIQLTELGQLLLGMKSVPA
jgi:hypothetical protein